MENQYYLGLDMGTSSVGWAVTDENYHLLRAKGKDLWGVRLFEEAQTGEERRQHRTARRRNRRDIARRRYLEECFKPEIEKLDLSFFTRIRESKLYPEDKSVKTPFTLFADSGYTDKEFYHDYPTIFHLRHELITSTEPHDVRLVFLAVLNIFNHRGHFLNPGLAAEKVLDVSELLRNLNEILEDVFGVSFSSKSLKVIQDELSNGGKSRSSKVSSVEKTDDSKGDEKKRKKAILNFIFGLKGNIKNLLQSDIDLNDLVETSFSFKEKDFDLIEPSLRSFLTEQEIDVLELLHDVYVQGELTQIMQGQDKTYSYISEARVASYEKHKQDLIKLKDLYRPNREEYNRMFRGKEEGSYSAYVGSVSSKESGRIRRIKKNDDKFFKSIKSHLSKIPDSDIKEEVLQDIGNDNFLPKQISSKNGCIPYQLHKVELIKILENASTYLPFLNETDDSGLTCKERIIQTFEFRLPYYFGPMAPNVMSPEQSENVWSVRKEPGAVHPWNIHQKFDVKETAENFITRMVSACTYLNDEQVLPKKSLLYEEFMVLNELNNLRINGELDLAVKEKIFNKLLLRESNVGIKQLVRFLENEGLIYPGEEVAITGIDQGFHHTRSTYLQFSRILGSKDLGYKDRLMIEEIIFWATVYGDSKEFLKEKIEEKYSDRLSEDQIKKVLKMKFDDWGNLSKEFLEIPGQTVSGTEDLSIIDRMRTENYNLSELVNTAHFTYKQEIEKRKEKLDRELADFRYEDLDGLYLSAPVKRMVWQTLLIVKEISKVMGKEPDRIFVEMARGGDLVKERSVSRKKKLNELYISCDTVSKELISELDRATDNELRQKKLYLYFLQRGRSMYSGKKINLENLLSANSDFDIDHIYPQSVIKDNNIENNLVLAEKHINNNVKRQYRVPDSIQEKMTGFWSSLKNDGLMSEEKFRRLTRKTDFSIEERADFIARQLVETRQGTKQITELLKEICSGSTIIYAKAGNVSDFRQKFNFNKCREVNDLHHAQDAYLNIVVGNVFYTRFTSNPYQYLLDCEKNAKDSGYNLKKLFEITETNNRASAWKKESLGIVKKVMSKTSPIIARRTYKGNGSFFNENPNKKLASKNGVQFPIKGNDSTLSMVDKYGGYDSIAISHFVLLEVDEKKGKRKRILQDVPLVYRGRFQDPEELKHYFSDLCGYRNIDIRLMNIPKQSLILLNGYPLVLKSRFDKNRHTYGDAVQIKISSKYDLVLKHCFQNRLELLTDEVLDGLFKEIIKVLSSQLIEKRYRSEKESISDILDKNAEVFFSSDLETKSEMIQEIIGLFHGLPGKHLTTLGLKKTINRFQINRNLSKLNSVILVKQSPTGLFEKRIDLLKV